MTRAQESLAWAAQPAAIAVVLWLALGGTGRNMAMPLAWNNDALFYLMQAKTTIDEGWWWTNPAISAPSGYHALLFPQSANIDQAIVWTAGLITRDVLTAVTLAWVVMLLLTGATSAWCLRRLGISRTGAWAAGVLFALCPFSLYRNIQHFNLMPYLLPFAAFAAVRVATAPDIDWTWRGVRTVLVGNLLLGFNATYFAFFGAFLITAGAAIGAARARRTAPLLAGASVVGIIVAATAINLLPSVMAWEREGRPRGVRHIASESETYGLKMRHLLSPLPDHWFPPFNEWTASEARAGFPVETENRLSRLGVVASAGFVGLLLMLFVPSMAGPATDGNTVRGLSHLTLAAVLFSTIGGLGSVFSLLVASDIRSYNRITPFIALFALAALALWLDRIRPDRTRATVWAAVLALGLADQAVALEPLNKARKSIATDVPQVRGLVESLERRLPAESMVFELPVRPYPVDAGIANMGIYDHFKPYLVSHTLRWSYPALSRAQTRAQDVLERAALADLPALLRDQGFSAILVDRFGYEDEGVAVMAQLRAVRGATPIEETEHYFVVDIRPTAMPAPDLMTPTPGPTP